MEETCLRVLAKAAVTLVSAQQLGLRGKGDLRMVERRVKILHTISSRTTESWEQTLAMKRCTEAVSLCKLHCGWLWFVQPWFTAFTLCSE